MALRPGTHPISGVALIFWVRPNGRTVSPPASYLKAGMPYQPQVTKCPCSWLGSSCVGIPSLRRSACQSRIWCRSHYLGVIATAGLLQGCVSSRNLKAGHQSLWETPELCDGSEAVGLVAHLLTDPPPRCRRDLRRLPQGSRKTSRATFAFDFASKYATVQRHHRDRRYTQTPAPPKI